MFIHVCRAAKTLLFAFLAFCTLVEQIEAEQNWQRYRQRDQNHNSPKARNACKPRIRAFQRIFDFFKNRHC